MRNTREQQKRTSLVSVQKIVAKCVCDSLEKKPQTTPTFKEVNYIVEERRVLLRQHGPEDKEGYSGAQDLTFSWLLSQ